jgi:TonB family protein
VAETLLESCSVRDLALVLPTTTFLPRHRQSMMAIAAVMHIALFALLLVVKSQPVRVSSLGSSYAGIAAYVAPATRASRPRAAAPRKTAPATTAAAEAPAANEAPQENRGDTASAAGSTVAVSGQSAGPVRLGSGATLTLLKKVPPIYPPVMQSARISGVVVLDAVIHADGTIGDITVLRSTSDVFERAAIEAVKKWRYTPLPYEGIVTVTVNFTLT